MTASDSVFLENSLVWGKSIRFSLFLLSLLSSFLSPPPSYAFVCVCGGQGQLLVSALTFCLIWTQDLFFLDACSCSADLQAPGDAPISASPVSTEAWGSQIPHHCN